MEWVSDEFIKENINYLELIKELNWAFRKKAILCPPKLAYNYKSTASNKENTLLLMTAWDNKKYVGVKIITATPINSRLNIPYINGQYVLLNAENGFPLINMDAKLITNIRTAATSVLASKYLAKKDASAVLILGNGRLSTFYIEAYASISNINTIFLWGRDFDKSKKVVSSLHAVGSVKVEAVQDFVSVVKGVDIISCITSAHEPIIGKQHLSRGQHFDLAGSYTKDMQEVTTEVVASCSIYTDNLDVTIDHSGELVNAINEHKIKRSDIKGDLKSICKDDFHMRKSEQENTLFKCNGMAIEDLVIAQLIYEKYRQAKK